MRRTVSIMIILMVLPGVCLGADRTALKQHMAGLLRSGGSASDLPATHPLSPLKDVPLTATSAWLLLHDDPALLDELYPAIEAIVMDYFTKERTDERNFIVGYRLDDIGSRIVCPGLNSMAAIDLHSLSLIASAAGRWREAIDARKMSRDYTAAITDFFFDHTNGLFLPVSDDGAFAPVYDSRQLLPLLLDGSIARETKTRIAERMLYEEERSGQGGSYSRREGTGASAAVKGLLPVIDGFPSGRIVSPSAGTPPHNGSGAWLSIWSDPEETRRLLLPIGDEMFVFDNLIRLLSDTGIMLPSEYEKLSSERECLSAALSADSMSLEAHIAATSSANRILVAISNINTIIDEEIRIWKVFQEYVWEDLSPRDRKRITQAFSSSGDEMLEAKRISSAKLAVTTGINAAVRMPDRPVPSGRKIDLEARIWTSVDELSIERLYLQAGSNRWKLTEDGERIDVKPGAVPNSWSRNLSVSPTSEPGLKSVPLFFDFISGGTRVEIHQTASYILTSGYDISLNYPAGRKLSGKGLPLNITVRYGTEHPIQGIVEGVFYRDLGCEPELPAKFLISEKNDITNLPLTIDPPALLPPGRYPFTLSVIIDGSTVAAFEDELVRPLNWLHLGPFPNKGWVIENATSLQDDLFSAHQLSDGTELHWSRVPAGALDEYGAVIPDRLYGSGGGRCILLYTVLTSQERRKVSWEVTSPNITSLWINEVPLIVNATGGTAKNGVTMLRDGRNSILILSAWDGLPGKVALEIGDENGMPVSGLGNNVDSVVKDFARVSESIDGDKSPSRGEDHPREVTFTINHSGAREISLIGEFNNWSPDSTPMRRLQGNMWSVTVMLPPGTYSYKFLVDRRQKLADPTASGSEPDGFGGTNSIISVK